MATERTKTTSKPAFDQVTYQWLLDATAPMKVDPSNIDTNVLVWNACLANLRSKIETIKDRR